MTVSYNQPLSICLVAHNAYGVLAKRDIGHVGGIEVQIPLMARWLAAKGHRVSVVTWNDGGGDGEVIDGVISYKLCARDDGLPGLRFFTPRWSSLSATLARADPRIVYYNCGDLCLGQIVLWAHRHNRKVVFSASSDIDCTDRPPVHRPLREQLLYTYGLKRTDMIIVQTQTQQALMRQNFGREADVIPMPCQGFSFRGNLGLKASARPARVLWAGRFNQEKRLELLLELAALNPTVQFDVVGGANFQSKYVESLYTRAAQISNVTLHGRVPHAQMAKFFYQATVVCCTSSFEGFPNVFLESWSAGVPLLTTFDPDGVVSRFGLGRVATDLDSLSSGLCELLSPKTWLDASHASLEYFNEYHSADSSLGQFEKRFLALAKQSEVSK